MGKTIGAYLGGRLIPYGRKRVFLWGNLFAILSSLLMQIVSLETLAIGKLLNGLFVTVVHIA
jgi:MFS family permease